MAKAFCNSSSNSEVGRMYLGFKMSLVCVTASFFGIGSAEVRSGSLEAKLSMKLLSIAAKLLFRSLGNGNAGRAVVSDFLSRVPCDVRLDCNAYNSSGSRMKFLQFVKLFDRFKLLICFAVPTARITCTVPTGVLLGEAA